MEPAEVPTRRAQRDVSFVVGNPRRTNLGIYKRNYTIQRLQRGRARAFLPVAPVNLFAGRLLLRLGLLIDV
jgi:hypothetical protein